MKLIKIFLASSEEMDYDRMAFGNLVRRLDDVYEKRGVRLKLFEWEDYDSAFNDKRKQSEYNEKVRESDMFLALFHKKAGEFTVEEFDVASDAFREKASPKVYTFLRDLRPGETASPELEEFKHRLFEEMGHFWCRYDNRDSLQFQFVMQLQLVENNMDDSLKVEDGEVRIDGMKVASMDKLRFAAGNEDYVKMSEELAALPEKIEKARLRLEKFPDDEDLIDDLQQKLDRYNKLKEEFSNYQKILFDTAKRIARLQSERITDRMRRAMDAFNEGKVREANIILDEAEADARRNLEDFKQFREITEQKRETVICSLEELLLKTSTVMADAGIPIEERINRTDRIYAQADEMAREIDYDGAKYAQMLEEYGFFLYEHAYYDRAIELYERSLVILEHLEGDNQIEIADCYNNLGVVYGSVRNQSRALYCLEKTKIIRDKVFGMEHPLMAETYVNLGNYYLREKDYEQALSYYKNAEEIFNNIIDDDDCSITTVWQNLGVVYGRQGNFKMAQVYCKNALKVRLVADGEMHLSTASAYWALSWLYGKMDENDGVLENAEKALRIYKECLGENHPSTASCYNRIGVAYGKKEEYRRALDSFDKALQIRKRIYGDHHTATASSLMNLGEAYKDLGDYSKALECYEKSSSIYESLKGADAPRTIETKKCVQEVLRLMDNSKT